MVTALISILSIAFPWSSTGDSEIFCTTFRPSATRPNTEYWPSSAGWSTTHTKNCEPPLSGLPGRMTLDTVPRVCFSAPSSALRTPRPPVP